MANIHLSNEEDFYILTSDGRDYIGRNTPTPEAPFIQGGAPVTVEECPVTSEEDQDVEVDYSNPIIDENDVEYALIVGGRPKSKKRN